MKLIQPNYDRHYYEAWTDGKLLGYWPNAEKLVFSHWLQDMHDMAIYGCTKRQHDAINARLADLMAGKKPQPLDYYLAEDTRKKYD